MSDPPVEPHYKTEALCKVVCLKDDWQCYKEFGDDGDGPLYY